MSDITKKYFYVKNLQKKWDTTDIQFSVNVEKNQMLVIAGHSGSGKSTVLRMIAGILKPDNKKDEVYSITLDGKEISLLPPGERDLGMVFQQHALFPHLRVDDNIAYGLRCRGITKKDSRIKASELLERFNLSGFESRYPSSLSGGEAQRVSLARTLIVKPKLVLFDEPFSSLDAPLRKSLAQDIKQLQKDFDFTGVLVTHDINEAKMMADLVVVMDKGKVIWQGTPFDFDEDKLVQL